MTGAVLPLCCFFGKVLQRRWSFSSHSGAEGETDRQTVKPRVAASLVGILHLHTAVAALCWEEGRQAPNLRNRCTAPWVKHRLRVTAELLIMVLQKKTKKKNLTHVAAQSCGASTRLTVQFVSLVVQTDETKQWLKEWLDCAAKVSFLINIGNNVGSSSLLCCFYTLLMFYSWLYLSILNETLRCNGNKAFLIHSQK